MLKNPHARLTNKMAQDPFAEQKQKMTSYFVLSSFGMQFSAGILYFLTISVLLGPHMLDMNRNVLASVDIDSEAFESERQSLVQLLHPALSPEERSAQSVEFKVALEEWAAQQEEFNTKALVVAGQTGVEPEQAAKNIQDTMAMEMLPYMALCVLVSFLLSSGVFLGWLKGFLFRRDFDGYRLGLRGKRGAVELTASRLGEIAWALVWRWGALGSALCLIIKVLDTLGITKAFVTLGIGPALLLFGGGCKTGGMGLIGGILTPLFILGVIFGILLYTLWRICAFLVESLLKVEFSDFKVVLVQHVDRGMMSEIRKDLFEEAPVVTMRMRLPTLEHWSGA
jgi:hypothetical protein